MKMRVYIGVLSMALGGTLAPVVVLAGFDFVPPAAVSAPADNTPDPVISSAPEQAVSPAPLPALVPQVIEAPTQPVLVASPAIPTAPVPAPVRQAPAPNKEALPVSDEAKTAAYPAPYQAPRMAAPVMPVPAPVAKQPVLEVSAPIKTPPLAIIAGFGDQIPLSFAMQQIVPSDFSVEYQDQPDPDTIVSWAGGRTWDKVLEDMLYAHGYRVRVVGKTVSIFKAVR